MNNEFFILKQRGVDLFLYNDDKEAKWVKNWKKAFVFHTREEAISIRDLMNRVSTRYKVIVISSSEKRIKHRKTRIFKRRK